MTVDNGFSWVANVIFIIIKSSSQTYDSSCSYVETHAVTYNWDFILLLFFFFYDENNYGTEGQRPK